MTSQHAMPFLIVNLGGEMLYILEQRLQAQNIPQEKNNKGKKQFALMNLVLGDVCLAMYNSQFMTELMKPQELYSIASTREVFERLAHASIMRLSTASMDKVLWYHIVKRFKLYDLMTMAFKYQLLACQEPRELFHITLNHVSIVERIIAADLVRLQPCKACVETFMAVQFAIASVINI